jgi:cytochrome c peroxidase
MKTMKTISVLLASAAICAASATAALSQGMIAPLAPLGDPPIPLDNPQTDAKVELGKMLFWDPRLGGDASTACVTCHEPDQGWVTRLSGHGSLAQQPDGGQLGLSGQAVLGRCRRFA